MNKKEAIEKIEKEKSNLNAWEDLTRNRALDDALAIVKELDEPEKTVLSEGEDKWLKGLKITYPMQTDQLYFVSNKVGVTILNTQDVIQNIHYLIKLMNQKRIRNMQKNVL